MVARKTDPVVRFWRQVDLSPASDCWIWTGNKNHLGYGQFWNGTKLVRAHRWSYQYMVNELWPDEHIDHLCSVRDCVNPEHLEAIPPGLNMQRASARGRMRGFYNHPDDVPSYGKADPLAAYQRVIQKIKEMHAAGTLDFPLTPEGLGGRFHLQTGGQRAALSWLAAAGIADPKWLIPPRPPEKPSPVDFASNYRKPGAYGTVRFVNGDPGVHVALPDGQLLWSTTEEYNTKPRHELDQEIAELAGAGVGVFVKEKT